MILSKESKILIAVIWFFFILALISAPMEIHPGIGPSYADKIVHFLLFGIMAVLLAFTLSDHSKDRLLVYALSFLVASLYSLICEIIQLFVPGRSSSLGDLLAGVSGVMVLLYLFYNQKKYRSFLLKHSLGKSALVSIFKKNMPKKLLLHICCAGCGVYVSQTLKADHDVTLFFYNPNIFPKTEYKKRADEARRIAKEFGLEIIIGEYSHKKWLGKIKGYEQEPEKGKRCSICYRDRLEAAARKAKAGNFQIFASTLSVSPHKNAGLLNSIGQEAAEKYGLEYLASDFKKNDGFKKASQLSKELKLYRQNYCGCEFSMRK